MKYLTQAKGISSPQSKETEGGRIYYLNVGYEDHGRPTAKVFVHSDCIENGEVRAMGCTLKKTGKGNYVIVPDKDHFVAVVGWESGFRGASDYSILTPVSISLPFKVYRSERGSLGVSKYALVSTGKDEMVKAKLTRSGRTYGKAKTAVQVIKVEGEEIKETLLPSEAEEDQELIELLGD